MQDDTPLQIEETREDEWIRLALSGELDIATARRLRERLRQLRDAGSHVRLDLSQLEFIDSAGAHVLAQALAESRADHWRLEIEPHISHQVRRFIEVGKAAGWHIDL
jgi:anti-sigma B factor antagonist